MCRHEYFWKEIVSIHLNKLLKMCGEIHFLFFKTPLMCALPNNLHLEMTISSSILYYQRCGVSIIKISYIIEQKNLTNCSNDSNSKKKTLSKTPIRSMKISTPRTYSTIKNIVQKLLQISWIYCRVLGEELTFSQVNARLNKQTLLIYLLNKLS